MIYSNLISWEKNQNDYPEAINQTLQYIKNLFKTNSEPGKYVLDGDNIYINLKDIGARSLSDCIPETHELYIDLQCYQYGEEIIRVEALSDASKKYDEYSEENDVLHYIPSLNETSVHMNPGEFIILFPEDIHRACGRFQGEGTTRKAVAKIHISQVR